MSMIERKSEAFIIVMTGFLLEHQDHSKFRYAGSNRNKTNGDIVITRVPSLSNYRSTFFRNTQALGDVKRLLPNDPAQYLTAVRILTLWYTFGTCCFSHMCGRPIITFKIIPFFLLSPGNQRLMHRLSRSKLISNPPRGEWGQITISSLGNRESAYHNDGQSMRGGTEIE